MPHTKSSIPRPNDDVLCRLYVDERKGCPEIAKLFGRDGKTVYWWLKQAGIQTRPRGSDERQQFKKGQRSAFAGRRHTVEARRKVGESSRRDGRVPYLRNGQHWLKGQSPSANGRWLGGVTPERQEFYRSVEWKSACRIVWARANATCERCSLDIRTVDRKQVQFHIHHVVSFASKALRAEPTNLVLLCMNCHRWVHSTANTDRQFLGVLEDAA